MTSISIVVASRLNTVFLKRLLASLEIQSFKKFEVLICATGSRQDQLASIRSLSPILNLRLIATPKPGIASARNQGIQKALGNLVLFLDEDCFLPRRDYLKELAQFHLEHPNFAAGGLYLNDFDSQQSDRFYNFVCNAWVASHQNIKNSPPVLLGGCCFYPLQLLRQHQILFDELNPRAGEEYLLNSLWTQRGLPLLLSSQWSVVHRPDTPFYQIFKKSWTQGAQRSPQKLNIQVDQVKKGLRYLRTERDAKLIYLPMLGLYGAIGRASFLTKFAAKYCSRTKRQKHKKHVLPPFVEKSVSKDVLMDDVKNKTGRKLNKKKVPLKISTLKNTQLIEKLAKTKPEESLYKT